VAAEDKSCAIAAWGYASILMSNPLQGIGASPKSAELAQGAASSKLPQQPRSSSDWRRAQAPTKIRHVMN
jgi:hypothetical protein